jgi:tetratricopeptide (TPR) repeat protein
VTPERHLWAQRFERNVAEIFEIAPEIANAVASEMGVELSRTEDTLLDMRREFSAEAYNDFLLGRFHYERKTPQDYQLAQQLFRRATEIDPQFSSAYVGLAHSYGSAAIWGIQDPSVAMPIARSLAERAIELDATLADAHLILAGVSFYWDWDVAKAENAVRRVLESNPNSAQAYRLLAEILSVTGRFEEALGAIERARELDPLSPTAQFKPVFTRYLLRDYEQAIELVRAGQEFYPDFWQGHWLLCLSLSALERHSEAIAACKAAVEYSNSASVALGGLGYAFARAGMTVDARRIVAELDAIRATRYVGAANLAIIHGALGELDPAFEELERAYENRDWLLVHMGDNAAFDPLRADDRFHSLTAWTRPPR